MQDEGFRGGALRAWLRLIIPPDWTVFTFLEKVTYLILFIGGVAATRWVAEGLFFLLFGY